MSEPQEQAAGASNVRRLSDAIREAKNAMADRDDVVVEMREATRARLEILAAELEEVIADAPAESPAFDFAISSGQQPRFWIDAVAHVGMGRDRRTYRFVRDTRNGRVVLAESTEVKPIADAVTRYVAERIVERQRDLDHEPAVTPQPVEEKTAAGTDADETQPTAAGKPAFARAPEPKRDRLSDFFSGVAMIALGLILGAAATILVLRERVPEIQNLF